jgi:outer membrane protein TolC
MEWCVRPMRRIFIWIFVTLCAAALLSGEAHAQPIVSKGPVVKLSLEKCIALALAENQKMKAAGYELEAAKGQVTEANARWKPVLDYEMQVAPVPTDVSIALKSFMTGSITIWAKLRVALGFPIYAFGAMTEAKKLAEGGVVAARHKVVKEREKLIFDVKQIYYGILFGKEMERLLKRLPRSPGIPRSRSSR